MSSDPPIPAAVSLFSLGFATLFLELVLIRYLAGSIWNLGYFPNFVLIAVFVGMGVGFVFHHYLDPQRSRTVFTSSGALLLLLTLFVALFHPAVPGFDSNWGGEIGGELYFTAVPDTGVGGIWTFGVWFLFVVAVFAAISQRTAKLFSRFEPLVAYSLDIGGACTGILAFMAVSALQLPAALWFVLAIGPLGVGAPAGRSRWGMAVLVLLSAGVVHSQDQQLLVDSDFAGTLEVTWSPYQKLEYIEGGGRSPFVFANGVAHQGLHDAATVERGFYGIPYRLRAEKSDLPPYKRVLIIGGGTGNDAAAALAAGAELVDVVEIDPGIFALGKSHHPARPYADPRVQVHVDDGRAFMNRAKGPYDLVVFALTDSLVKASAMAQLRLENYLFTEEAMVRAFSLLSETGDLVLYNYYRHEWLLDKLLWTQQLASGHQPAVMFAQRDFAILGVGRTSPEWDETGPAPIATPSDDWPFLYLQHRGIPGIYAWVIAGLTTLVLGLMGLLQWSTRHQAHGETLQHPLLLKAVFVLLGTAFLLLETKSVVQFSLLFGTTWVNASLVFLGILLLVLLANWTAALFRGPPPLRTVYLLLLVSCLVPMAVPLSDLLALDSRVTRFLLASLLTFSPIFFANLLFSLIFARQKRAEHLFGWNLLGATLGGVIEYCSMATGYASLAVTVALLYSVAFLCLLVTLRKT